MAIELHVHSMVKPPKRWSLTDFGALYFPFFLAPFHGKIHGISPQNYIKIKPHLLAFLKYI